MGETTTETKKRVNMVWVLAGLVVCVALIIAFAPGVLAWVLPMIGGGTLIAAKAVNKEKRKEEKAATKADLAERAAVQEEIVEQKTSLAETQKEQQKLFLTSQEDAERLNEEYRQAMQKEYTDSHAMSSDDKLAYLKSRTAGGK